MAGGGGRVAVVLRGDASLRETMNVESTRFAPVFAALADAGLSPEPVVYSDMWAEETRRLLAGVDAVLVWVDPVAGDGDRSKLDAILREVSAAGVWVGSHPDVIAKMGTKEVLHTTRSLGWGSDTHLYSSQQELLSRFPARLATDGIRVLKPSRGNAGIGVWKVTLGDGRGGAPTPAPDTTVRIQHALIRDESAEEVTLAEVMSRAATSFAAYGGRGAVVDQAFCRNIDRGIVRAYVVGGRVVGFARQYPKGLSPEDRMARSSEPPPGVESIMGLPSRKVMYPPDAPAFADLRTRLETDWIPGMQRILQVPTSSLPALWDADFFLEPSSAGRDRYVLCEINASSVAPFPPEAVPELVRVTVAALHRSGPRPGHNP